MSGSDDYYDREIFAQILATWVREGEKDSVSQGRIGAKLARFSICRPDDVIRLLARPRVPTLNLYNSRRWICGPHVSTGTPVFLPFATAMVDTEPSGELKACIRVAFIFESADRVDWVAWRFESADRQGDEPSHPYAHAQHIVEWAKDVSIDFEESGVSQLNKSADGGRFVNERRPAFPLRGGQTISGLAVAMLAALYGAPQVRRWLQLLSRGAVPSAVRQDIASILG